MLENLKSGLLEKIVPALLVISVALAFAVGVLWQKVAVLEGSKMGGSQVASDKGADSGIEGPDVNGKLSDDQKGKVAGVADEDHIRGNKSAQVFLIEYSDLECPFCKQFHSTAKQVVEEYDGKVAWVYRHFPLDTLHPKADKEAEAAECAFDQGGNDGFWEYIDRVYEITPSNNGLDESKLPEIAGDLDLDLDTFNSCLSSGKFKDKVEEHYQQGITAGVTGTPGNFIMNKQGEVWVIPGAVPLDSLKTTIDEALKG